MFQTHSDMHTTKWKNLDILQSSLSHLRHSECIRYPATLLFPLFTRVTNEGREDGEHPMNDFAACEPPVVVVAAACSGEGREFPIDFCRDEAR